MSRYYLWQSLKSKKKYFQKKVKTIAINIDLHYNTLVDSIGTPD